MKNAIAHRNTKNMESNHLNSPRPWRSDSNLNTISSKFLHSSTIQPPSRAFSLSVWTFLTHSILGQPGCCPGRRKNLRVSNHEGAQTQYSQTSNILMWATSERMIQWFAWLHDLHHFEVRFQGLGKVTSISLRWPFDYLPFGSCPETWRTMLRSFWMISCNWKIGPNFDEQLTATLGNSQITLAPMPLQCVRYCCADFVARRWDLPEKS